MTGTRLPTVECYSGHTYAQEPRAVITAEGTYCPVQILLRWRTPEGPAFRVRTEAGDTYAVHYLESDDRWTVFPLPAVPLHDGTAESCK